MREVALAGALFVLLAAAAFVLRAASAEWGLLFYAGGFLVVAGLLFSLPCAVRYHLLLRGALAPRGALDRGWIWNPTGHHARLTDAERARVLPWFYAGAAGWGASVLGCLCIGLGALAVR